MTSSLRAAVLALCLLLSLGAYGAAEMTVSDLKLQKRFGIGVSAGGPLGVLGTSVDVNLSEYWSISAGLGTGLDYSTMMAKTLFYLPGRWVSPYIGGGIARWWTSGTNSPSVAPSGLVSNFLGNGYDRSQGFNIWMFYPAAGVQFMHPLGIAFFAEVEYLFRFFSLAGGAYAGLGMHWYF